MLYNNSCECWRYLGEGGKHAIFSYSENPSADDNASNNYHGKVLRIEKKHLAISEIFEGNFADIFSHEGLEKSMLYHSAVYIQRYLLHSMHPYICVGDPIPLSWDFLKKLRAKTIGTGRVPSSRKSDWFMDNAAETRVEITEIPYGVLLPDYRLLEYPGFQPQFAPAELSKCFSFEMKPKAGYIAFSPLVHPNHRIKYHESRFVSLQYLCRDGISSKGWMRDARESTFRISPYDPLKLFSGDVSAIRQSLIDLLSNCQNNLRVWVDGAQVVGNGGENTNESRDDGMEIYSVSDKLLEILSQILAREAVLKKVLSLQKLDILDADGAFLVYQRMVNQCGGSEAEAEKEIEKYDDLALSELGHAPHPLLYNSPFLPPSVTSNIVSYCREVEEFARVVDDDASSSKKFDEARNRAMLHVNALTKDECRYLLQNWLLSSSMCDCSVFVTFRMLPLHYLHTKSNSTAGPSTTILMDNPSTMTVDSGRSNSTVEVIYQVRLIDCDNKPARKLRHLEKREQPFNMRNIMDTQCGHQS
jgi:hypothetical protein